MCQHSNVQTLTSPPVLKLWDSQGYLWLPYDLTKVINLVGVTFKQKKIFFFKKILYVIPSALLSFLPYYHQSFRIIVISSGLLSFLPDHCHSFRITVIPSVLVSLFSNIVIPSKLFGDLQIPTSSKTFPSPKDEKNGHICEFK